MYFDLYALLQGFIYGADVTLTNYQDLTLTIMSTVGVLFVVGLPFMVVWRIIKGVLR